MSSRADPLDRLAVFDRVEAPEQWGEIVERAQSDLVRIDDVRDDRRPRWLLAVAAATVLIATTAIVLSFAGDDGSITTDTDPQTLPTAPATTPPSATSTTPATTTPATTPVTAPVTTLPVPRLVTCADDSLAIAATALRAGYGDIDVDPALDMTALIDRSSFVVRGTLASVARSSGSEPPGATLTVAVTDVVVQSPNAIAPDRVTIPWAPAPGDVDPLAEPVAFDGVEVVAFIRTAPGGYVSDAEGLYLGCGAAAALPVPERAGFVDAAWNLDQIAEAARTTFANLAVGWSNACVERPGDGDIGATTAGLGTFGPLGNAPVLDIALPSYRDEGEFPASEPLASVAKVPGGTIVLVGSESADLDAPVVLAAVDDDGSVRWRRCLLAGSSTRLAVAAGDLSPTTGYLSNDAGQLLAVDLATGADADPPAGVDGLIEQARSRRYVVYGRLAGTVSVVDDRLRVLDLATGDVRDVPYPESADGRPFGAVPIGIDPEHVGDAPVLFAGDGDVTSAVFTDGEWRSDPETIVSVSRPSVIETFGDATTGATPRIEAHDALGNVQWTYPTLGALPAEGFHVADAGGVTLANVCTQPTAESCDAGALIGLDTATGELLWQLDGFRGVSAYGDGYALITDAAVYEAAGDGSPTSLADGYEMIDLRTGDPAGGNAAWSGFDTFLTTCCGDADYRYVARDGGVVYVVNGARLTVWFPKAASRPTADLSLDG